MQNKSDHYLGAESFFNEGTAINVPPYVLHRDERYFSPSTDSFWPDRWLVPELRDFSVLGKENNDLPVITNTSAFIPFSIGHANCAGKRLALAEMRTVIVYLLHHFDMRLAEGYDPSLWEKSATDKMILKVGELPVSLTPRL